MTQTDSRCDAAGLLTSQRGQIQTNYVRYTTALASIRKISSALYANIAGLDRASAGDDAHLFVPD